MYMYLRSISLQGYYPLCRGNRRVVVQEQREQRQPKGSLDEMSRKYSARLAWLTKETETINRDELKRLLKEQQGWNI